MNMTAIEKITNKTLWRRFLLKRFILSKTCSSSTYSISFITAPMVPLRVIIGRTILRTKATNLASRASSRCSASNNLSRTRGWAVKRFHCRWKKLHVFFRRLKDSSICQRLIARPRTSVRTMVAGCRAPRVCCTWSQYLVVCQQFTVDTSHVIAIAPSRYAAMTCKTNRSSLWYHFHQQVNLTVQLPQHKCKPLPFRINIFVCLRTVFRHPPFACCSTISVRVILDVYVLNECRHHVSNITFPFLHEIILLLLLWNINDAFVGFQLIYK